MSKIYSAEHIEAHMQQLKMGGLAKHWDKVPFINKEQYITELLELEINERRKDKINRAVNSAGFDVVKTIEDFVWSNSINIPNSITQAEIENLSFVGKKENLIFVGAVGTGKTHLATGIALRACQLGMNARFFTAANLANILLEKNQKGSLNSFLNSLKKLDLMVIDEVGFVPLQKDAAELLFQVVSNCYERRSLIITSNLEFSQWNNTFGDNRLTAALVDRLIHHSHIFVFSGRSFRLKESIDRSAQKGAKCTDSSTVNSETVSSQKSENNANSTAIDVKGAMPKICGECPHHCYYTDGSLRTKAGDIVDTSKRMPEKYTHYCLAAPSGFRKIKSESDWHGAETPTAWCPLSAADNSAADDDVVGINFP